MKMRRIWRLENSKGSGVYRGNCDRCRDALYATFGGTFGSDRHPMPDADILLQDQWTGMSWSRKATYLFGFASLAQYRAWFFKASGRRALKEAGARLKLYYVPEEDFLRGMNQAIFIPDRAVLKCERSPDI